MPPAFPPSIESPVPVSLRLWVGTQPWRAVRDGQTLVIESESADERSVWTLEPCRSGPCLAARMPGCAAEKQLQAALQAIFLADPGLESVAVNLLGTTPEWLRRLAPVRLDADGGVTVERSAFWQQAGIWTPPVAAIAGPVEIGFTAGRPHPHPRRPPKPDGVVYRRAIPWLARTLSFRALDLERDLPAFHRWMNDPVVDRFWGESGDLARHRAYLEGIAADPHAAALVASLDDEAFAYFEVYWAHEDRIAPFCDAGDHDRGWHVLVGEPAFRGRRFLTAWMPSISHYLFLDEPRTRRLVIEPRSDNDRMIRSLARCGYTLVKEFDFPHKRAVLGVLPRDRFFDEAGWVPRAEPTRETARDTSPTRTIQCTSMT